MKGSWVRAAVSGVIAGIASGLFGVGGGLVIVPLLTIWLGFEQHRAHATSLGAVVPIAIVGASTFAFAGEVDPAIAVALGAGSLIGVPLGAAAMRRADAPTLRVAFGAFMVVVGLLLIVT